MDEQYIDIVVQNTDAVARLLDSDRNAGYESALAACMDALDSEDVAIWQTSFVIAEVAKEKNYGANIVGDLAKRLGMSFDVAKNRKRCGAFWREEMESWSHFIRVPTMRYSHFLDSLKLNDRNQILWFMEQVADAGMSVPEARKWLGEIRGQMPPPETFLRGTGFISSVDSMRGHFTARLEQGADLNGLIRALDEGALVEFVIRASGDPLKSLKTAAGVKGVQVAAAR